MTISLDSDKLCIYNIILRATTNNNAKSYNKKTLKISQNGILKNHSNNQQEDKKTKK